ncbi:MAG: hypothetical protein IPM89_10455 [Candidatus Competibacteraceae bacterium]|nr:MAG: hypothetical protein IPM89_10455 [Candidatus Competibacteraceae bacterium]
MVEQIGAHAAFHQAGEQILQGDGLIEQHRFGHARIALADDFVLLAQHRCAGSASRVVP